MRVAAAAQFVSSKPCIGVTVNEVAVPDVRVPPWLDWATRVSAAVRSLFAFDSFTKDNDHISTATNEFERREARRTAALRLIDTRPDLA